MHWKLEYCGTLAAQKVIGGVPGLYRLQEAVKAAVGRFDSNVDVGFAARRFEEKTEQFRAAGLEPPRAALEQGTGWHGADLVYLHLAGAERIHTYDTRPWLRPGLVRAVAARATELSPIVARWTGDAAGAAARATALARIAEDPSSDLLGALSVTYEVTTSMRRASHPAGSFDLVFTDSVLQRVTPGDLSVLLEEFRRVLRPTGRTHHVVDCKDLHAIRDARVPELGYLKPREWVWRAMSSRYLNYQNRLRMSQFVEAFERAGFEVRSLRERRAPENLEFVRRNLASHPAWSRLDAIDVSVSRFELVGAPAKRERPRLDENEARPSAPKQGRSLDPSRKVLTSPSADRSGCRPSRTPRS